VIFLGKWILNLLNQINRYLNTQIVKIQCAQWQNPLQVNGRSRVTRHTFLGKNVNFNGIKINGCGTVRIGQNFHSGEDCLMITQIHNYNGTAIPYDATYIKKDIIIEDNVWLGDRVIILGGVTLGEGVIIQAGSVVVKSVPKYAIAGGHPAEVYKFRDINHYESLKAQGRYF
jgi:acetyltransferase-like isoleucine patch superfamily enzyme